MEPKNFKTILLDYLTITDLNEVLKNLSIDTQFNSKIDQIQAIDKELKTNIHELIMNINLKGINTLIEKYKLDYAKNKSLYNKKRAILTHLLANYHSQFNSNLDEVKIRLSGLFESDDKNSMYESIFKLDNFLYKKKEELKFPKLNPEYISESIINSLKTSKEKVQIFKSVDYQSSALVFLRDYVKKDKKPEMLISLTDEYFKDQEIVNLLSAKDIEYYKSEKTICKFYFQRAVGELNDIGLIKKGSNERDNKFLPNTLGILVGDLIKLKYSEINGIGKYPNNLFLAKLLHPIHLGGSYNINPTLHSAIMYLGNYEEIAIFINDNYSYLSEALKQTFKELVNKYYKLFNDNVIVENKIDDLGLIKRNSWCNHYELQIKELLNKENYYKLARKIWIHENIQFGANDEIELFD